jgi:hypothetical protein
MNVGGLTILICKAGGVVCELVVLICEIFRSLENLFRRKVVMMVYQTLIFSTIYFSKKIRFIRFRNWNYFI